MFTDQECDRLIRSARQYQDENPSVKWELIIQMALCTGMRRGELLNTIWRDIDFEKKTVEVSPKNDGANIWEWHIKDTDRRTLPLTDEVIQLLTRHQAEQTDGNPYVFVPSFRYERIQQSRQYGEWTVEDGRCPLNNFPKQFKVIRSIASIEDRDFHDLRRTCLSNWLAGGLSEYEVMILAGHSKFETTHRFYLAVRGDLLKHARAIAEEQREGNFVARLLRAPLDCQKRKRLTSISACQP